MVLVTRLRDLMDTRIVVETTVCWRWAGAAGKELLLLGA